MDRSSSDGLAGCDPLFVSFFFYFFFFSFSSFIGSIGICPYRRSLIPPSPSTTAHSLRLQPPYHSLSILLLPFLGGICIPRCIILGRLSLITVKYDRNPSFFDGAAFPPRNRRSSPDTALVPRKSGCIRVTIRPIGGLNNTLLAHSCREGNNTSVTVA